MSPPPPGFSFISPFVVERGLESIVLAHSGVSLIGRRPAELPRMIVSMEYHWCKVQRSGAGAMLHETYELFFFGFDCAVTELHIYVRVRPVFVCQSPNLLGSLSILTGLYGARLP